MEFKFILHAQITNEALSEIVSLKKTHWDYSLEEHTTWIQNNLQQDDIHVMMSRQNEVVAYMNLVQIEVAINHEKTAFLGVGNVCSKEKGKGYGKLLLLGVNDFLKAENKKGILLCKNELVDFYAKYHWSLVDKAVVNEKYKNINMMTFNLNEEVGNLNYDGRNF